MFRLRLTDRSKAKAQEHSQILRKPDRVVGSGWREWYFRKYVCHPAPSSCVADERSQGISLQSEIIIKPAIISFFRIIVFLFPKKEQLLSESVFPSVAGKNSDWLSLSRAFSASSGKYSLAVRGKYGFARLFRNLSEKSRLRCFAVLSVRKAYKTRQPNAIVLWRTISEDNAVLWVFRALKTLTNPSFSRLHRPFPGTPFIPCRFYHCNNLSYALSP